MPLLAGKENIGKNIKTEEIAGKSHAQAVAIALRVAAEKKKKSKNKPEKENKKEDKMEKGIEE